MERTLQEIENLWEKKEQPILTNLIQNNELAEKFAKSKIIIKHTRKEEDIWRINLLLHKFNLTHSNYITYYGRQPIPYKEEYFFVIEPMFHNSCGHVIWDVPKVLFQIKPTVHIHEIYTKY